MCPKCSGFVVNQIIIGEGGVWINDDHCVNCGKRVNLPVVERDRFSTKQRKRKTYTFKWRGWKT